MGSGIYATNSAEICEFIIKDCGARYVIVENELQLEKILKCKKTCNIDLIVQYTGNVVDSRGGLVTTVCIHIFPIL